MYRDLAGFPQSPPIQSTLEIVPEEDDLASVATSNNNNINDEPFPLPPPPSLLLVYQQQQQQQQQQQSLLQQDEASHSVTPPLPPPPPPQRKRSSSSPTDGALAEGARVWSAMDSSSTAAKDGEDANSFGNNENNHNAHVIRFYLDQVLVNAREVITFVCGLIVLLLMILCLASPDWLLTDKFRQGLWVHCIAEDAPSPLPFNLTERGGCFHVRSKGYIQASATLCVICLLFDVLATAMTAFSLFIKDPGFKRRLYRFTIYVMLGALLNILVALIVYPSCFGLELETSNRRVWEFGWAYGVGWGGAIFLFGAIVLLLCDKNQQEVYYRERTIGHSDKEYKA